MKQLPAAQHRNHRPTVGTRACIQFSPPSSLYPRSIGGKGRNWETGPPRRFSINRTNQISSSRARSGRRNERVIDGIIRRREVFSETFLWTSRRRRQWPDRDGRLARPLAGGSRREGPATRVKGPAGPGRREKGGRDERRRCYFRASSSDFRPNIKQWRDVADVTKQKSPAGSKLSRRRIVRRDNDIVVLQYLTL